MTFGQWRRWMSLQWNQLAGSLPGCLTALSSLSYAHDGSPGLRSAHARDVFVVVAQAPCSEQQCADGCCGRGDGDADREVRFAWYENVALYGANRVLCAVWRVLCDGCLFAVRWSCALLAVCFV